MSRINTYGNLQTYIADQLRHARSLAVRSVKAVMTASYWEVGRRIVEAEQKGKRRAAYGEQLIQQLALDLTAEFGRSFSEVYLKQMRRFHLIWPVQRIWQTLSAVFESPSAIKVLTESEPFTLADLALAFSLSGSAYVSLLPVDGEEARQLYENEALRSLKNPSLRIILCSQKGAAQAHHALNGLPNKLLAALYQTMLSSAEQLIDQLRKASAQLPQRGRA